MPCKTLLSLLTVTLLVALPGPAEPQVLPKPQPKSQLPPPSSKLQPKLEPIAETKLLMEGLAHPNFRGLDRLLAKKPSDAQTWTFARGQAVLIAETANLLMLRPPRSK